MIKCCISGFCSKVGTGIGVWLVGITMALGGFDGTANVQSKSAITSVTLLYSIIPAAFFLSAVIGLSFYNLEKKMPQIQMELKEGNEVGEEK